MEAVQVLSVEADGRYVANIEALRQAASTGGASLPVAVVSVAGATRGGKSFLLDFFLRYLHAPEESRHDSSWLGDEEEPLTGFGWRGGCDRHTEGILMWPEPVVVTLGTGDDTQQVAVVLLDTQGSFDSSSTVRDSSTVFAISTLLASAQLYNLTQNIKEDDLQYLQLFTEYGKLARDERDTRPFQELMFLVRDWAWAYQHPYGAAGGQDLLDKRLEIRDEQAEELRGVRAHIRAVFERVGAYLLPHPGLPAATNPAFNGCLKDITPEFKTSLRDLVPSLLGPQQLSVKHINGQTVTLQDFVHYFTTYVEIFNSDTLPTPTTVMQATSAACVEAAVRACRAEYAACVERCARGARCLPRAAPARHHAAALRRASATYRARRTFTPELAAARLHALIQELEGSLVQHIAINNAHILEAAATTKTVYETEMSTEKCLTTTDLQELHEAAIDVAKIAFVSAFAASDELDLSTEECDDSEHSEEDQNDIEKDWEAVKQELQELLPLHRERNEARIEGTMLLAQEIYTSEMSEAVRAHPCLHPVSLRTRHRASAGAARDSLARCWRDELTPQQYQQRLRAFTEERFAEFAMTNDANNEREIELAISVYRDIMVEICDDRRERCLHPKDLSTQHARAQATATARFQEQRGDLGRAPVDVHQKNLIRGLIPVYKEFKSRNEARNKEAVKSAHEYYTSHISPGQSFPFDFLLAPDLNVIERHGRVKQDAIQHFLSKRRPGEAAGDDPYLQQLDKEIEDSYSWLVAKLFLGMAAQGLSLVSLVSGLRR